MVLLKLFEDLSSLCQKTENRRNLFISRENEVSKEKLFKQILKLNEKSFHNSMFSFQLKNISRFFLEIFDLYFYSLVFNKKRGLNKIF